MKQYIKLFAVLLCLGGTLASCADDKDYDNYDGLAYPEKVTLGCWQYSDGVTDYNVNITLNAAGDTVCNVVLVEPTGNPDDETEMDAYTMSNGLLQSYSQVTGLAEFYHASSMWGLPAYTYIALQRDLKTHAVQLIPYDPEDNYLYTDYTVAFKLPTVAKPSFYGYWAGIGETSHEDGYVEQGGMLEILINYGGTCVYGVNGDYKEGTYTISADGTTCDIVANDGISAPLHLGFNALNQLVGEAADGSGIKWLYLLDKDAA